MFRNINFKINTCILNILRIFVEIKTKIMKKAKLLHLTTSCIKSLTLVAVEEGTNFKTWVQNLLEAESVKYKNGIKKTK